jgi:hypothetical protein
MAKDGSIGWGLGTDSVWKYEGKAWRNDLEGSLAAVGVDPQVLWASDDGQAAWAIGKRGVLRLRQGRWQQDTRSTSNLPDDFGPVDGWTRNDGMSGFCIGSGGVLRLSDGVWAKDEAASAASKGVPVAAFWARADGGEAWILGKNGFAVHMLEGKWERSAQFEAVAPGFSAQNLWIRGDGKEGWAFGANRALRLEDNAWSVDEAASQVAKEIGFAGFWVQQDGQDGWLVGETRAYQLVEGVWVPRKLPRTGGAATPMTVSLFISPDGQRGWAFGESNWQLNRGSWTPGPLLNAFPDLVVFNPAQRTILAVANHGGVFALGDNGAAGWQKLADPPMPEIKLDERSLFATNGDWVYFNRARREATFRNEVWKERETAVSSLAAADFDESGQNGWGFQKYGGPARLVNGEWQPAQPLKTAGSPLYGLIGVSKIGDKGWALQVAGLNHSVVAHLLRLDAGKWAIDEQGQRALAEGAMGLRAWDLWVSSDGELAWLLANDGAWRRRDGQWARVNAPARSPDRSTLWIAKDGQSGWLCGSEIWRLKGDAWHQERIQSGAAPSYACWVNEDGSQGWAVGPKSVLKLKGDAWELEPEMSKAAEELGNEVSIAVDPAGRNGWAASSKGVLHLSDGEWRAHQDGSRVFATESPTLLLSKDATRGWAKSSRGLFRLDSLLVTAPKAQATSLGASLLESSFRFRVSPGFTLDRVELGVAKTTIALVPDEHYQVRAPTLTEEGRAPGDFGSLLNSPAISSDDFVVSLKASKVVPPGEFSVRISLRHPAVPNQLFVYETSPFENTPPAPSTSGSESAFAVPLAGVAALGAAVGAIGFLARRRRKRADVTAPFVGSATATAEWMSGSAPLLPSSTFESEVARSTTPERNSIAENEAEAQLRRLRDSAKDSFERNRGRGLIVGELRLIQLPFFGNLTWSLSSNVNVLLGRNGYGKSHLLRILASVLARDPVDSFFVSREQDGSTARVEVDLRAPDSPAQRGTEEAANAGTIQRAAKEWLDEVGKVPVLAIGDTRFFDRSKGYLQKQDLRIDERMPEGGAYHFIRQLSNGHLVEHNLFLLCLDYTESAGARGFLLDLLARTVAELAENGFKIVDISRRNRAENRYEILVRTEGNEEPIPLHLASQGTLNVLAIFLQIFYYLAALYPSLQGDAKELTCQRAIVIIDEIDAHLHPAWQRHIVPVLRAAFPNVQFILSAHSPLIVAGCRSGEVANLVRREGAGFTLRQFDEDFLGREPAEILRRVQDVETIDVRYLTARSDAARRVELEAKRTTLSVLESLNADQERRLNELDRQLFDIDLSERRAEERMKQTDLVNRIAHLERELRTARREAETVEEPTAGEGRVA